MKKNQEEKAEDKSKIQTEVAASQTVRRCTNDERLIAFCCKFEYEIILKI